MFVIPFVAAEVSVAAVVVDFVVVVAAVVVDFVAVAVVVVDVDVAAVKRFLA